MSLKRRVFPDRDNSSISVVAVTYSEVSFDLPHIQLKGLRGGTPGKPLLLLLHGWLDNCHSFLPLLSEPELADYDWIALDFAGHGHSSHRGADAAYYFVDYMYDVQTLIEQQGWQHLHVVGHSMGGYVGQLLGACFGERIASLVTIEAFGLVTGEPEQTLQLLRDGYTSRRKQFGRELPTYTDLNHLIRARAKAGDFTPELAELLLRRNLTHTEAGFRWRTDPRARTTSPFRFTEQHVPSVLQALQMPVQVVLGEDGHAQLPDALAQWGAHVQQLSVVQVAGGHHAHMQSPRSVAQAIRAHLDASNMLD
ncbi:MAG: alpha/beta hydrolase [Idiomarina sp.]|nr:alpha/beta hydrolase [Idiomarina sp.]